MSLNKELLKQIGQMFMVGLPGEEINDTTIKLIKEFHIGNFVLYERRNLKSLENSVNLIYKLKKLCLKYNGIQPFIAVDHEGGVTSQLFKLAPVYPGNMALSALDIPKSEKKKLVFKEASCLAEDVKSVGFNMNLAPVVEIASFPENPSIGSRSFGDTPEVVSEFAVEYIKAHKKFKVATVAKHFPGASDVPVDTHDDIISYNVDIERLKNWEIKPFTAVFNAGVNAIMTLHLHFPMFDKEKLPASLSKNVLIKLLRQEMKFKGLVISDDLEMSAVEKYFDINTSSEMAVNAGVDIMLVCHTAEKMMQAVENVYKKVENKKILLDRIKESYTRIYGSKKSLGLCQKKVNKPDLKKIYHTLWKKEKVQFAREYMEKGVTVVKDEQKIIPLKLHGTENVLVIDPFHVKFGINTVVELSKLIRTIYPKTDGILFDPKEQNWKERVKYIKEYAEKCDILIIGTDDAQFWPSQIELVKELTSIGKPYIVVATRNPFDIIKFPFVKTYIATYTIYDIALDGAAKIIFGKSKSVSKLPVDISSKMK